jgi:hypothetical protein
MGQSGLLLSVGSQRISAISAELQQKRFFDQMVELRQTRVCDQMLQVGPGKRKFGFQCFDSCILRLSVDASTNIHLDLCTETCPHRNRVFLRSPKHTLPDFVEM